MFLRTYFENCQYANTWRYKCFILFDKTLLDLPFVNTNNNDQLLKTVLHKMSLPYQTALMFNRRLKTHGFISLLNCNYFLFIGLNIVFVVPALFNLLLFYSLVADVAVNWRLLWALLFCPLDLRKGKAHLVLCTDFGYLN